MKKRSRARRRKQRRDEFRVTRTDLRQLLQRLGLTEVFTASAPPGTLARACKLSYPLPRAVCIDPAGVFSEHRRLQLQREVTHIVGSTPIRLEDPAIELSPAEAATVLHAVLLMITMIKTQQTEPDQEALSRARSVWEATLNKIVDHLLHCAAVGALRQVGFQNGMVTRQVEWQPQPGKPPRPLIKLHAVAPRQRRFQVNGKVRNTYQIGSTYWSPLRADWIELPRDLLGWPDTAGSKLPEKLPVFIQSHALRRLHERTTMPSIGGVASEVIYYSLRDPVVARHTRSGSPMIACRYFDARLGYFVADLIDDAIVLRTFLTVTMDGTPDAPTLYKALHTGPHGVQTMGLDRLETLLTSDIPHDADLQKVFGDAGLEPILSLAKTLGPPAHLRRAKADHVRRYLGMPSHEAA